MIKSRNYSLDLLRILAMLGIVGLHVIINGGIILNSSVKSFNYYLLLLLVVLFMISVDIFGLLTGYLNIEKTKHKTYRLLELLTIVFFYSIVITIVFYTLNFFDIKSYGIKTLIKSLVPFFTNSYWYITYYIFLYFLIPYLNSFCKKIDKKNFEKLLIIVFILLCIIPTLLGGYDIFRIIDGYSPFWLIYCYLIGAYIKLYGFEIDKNKLLKYGFILFIFTFLFNAGIRYLLSSFSLSNIKVDWMITYNSPTVLLGAIIVFLLFNKFSISSKYNRLIVYFSSTSFVVYIIHCHMLIYDYVLNNAFKSLLNYNSIILIVLILLFIVAIYIICSLFDILRKNIFKFFKIEKILTKLSFRFDRLLN